MSWKVLLTDVPSVCSLIAEVMTQTNLTFWIGGYMSEHMATLGMDENDFGFLVSANMGVFIVTCLIAPFTCEHLPRRFVFVCAMFGLGIAALMIGPSSALGLPDSVGLISAGVLIQGIFCALPTIMCVPEIIERLTVKLECQEGIDDHIIFAINDKANDANCMLESAGHFIGLLAGTKIYKLTENAHRPGEFIALANFVVFTCFLIFNCGLNVFSENRAFHDMMHKLKKPVDSQSL